MCEHRIEAEPHAQAFVKIVLRTPLMRSTCLAVFQWLADIMAAAMAGLDANTRAQIIKLLGGLQGGAAGALGKLGTTEQTLAETNREDADQASQQQMQNWQNSILGEGLGIGAGAGTAALLGV